MRSSKVTYTFKGLDDQSIIDAIINGSGLPCRKVDEYSESELRQLAGLLINAVRCLAAKAADIDEDGLQEWIDNMYFKAGKDSSTSSMRPSSDMYRSTVMNDAGEAEIDTNSTDNKNPGNTEPPADNGQGIPVGQSTDTSEADPEKQAEEELRKDHDRTLRKKSGKKPGGQKGHSGNGFHIPPTIDEVKTEIIPPEKCKGCTMWEQCKEKAKPGIKHNEFDIEIKITQTVYVPVDVTCPTDGERTFSDYPDHVKGVNQYGINIQTLICLLYCVGMVSLDRIRKIVGPLLGLKISTATMKRYISILASNVKETVEAILAAEKAEKSVHCDETGAKVDGQLYWIHCISTSLYTFVSFQVKRGKEGMDAIGFLCEYVGTVVHDCWSSYWNFDNCTHAVCNGHIQRELVGLSKFFHNAKLWADDMVTLLQEMLHTKHLAQEQGLSSLTEEEIDKFSRRFDDLIAKGKELHPLPERKPGQKGKLKRGRARALIDRMEMRKPEIFRFLTDFDIPYTNNIAEASFRLLGTKRSVGCFRSLEAAQEFCVIWSYLSTCAKHGISYYEAVKKAFEGKSMDLLFPDGLPRNTNNNQTDEAA